jgi:hypothetical protein
MSAHVSEHDVARRAYDLYVARDREHGHDVDDWLQAERELRTQYARPQHDEIVAPHAQQATRIGARRSV